MGFPLMPMTNSYQVPSLHSNYDDYKITSPNMGMRLNDCNRKI